MPSVALIGPDGAGKTTLTRMLLSSGALPFRYIYMGVDIGASNVALPTSRMAERWKRHRGTAASRGAPAPAADAIGRGPTGGRVRAVLRLSNRLLEEWYRQLVSWSYQARGEVVLYDRHFLFDFAPEILAGQPTSWERRVHSWFLRTLYPRPDLVLFLDAPGALLYARKGESTPEELERRRQAFLQVGKRFACFERIDATRPLTEVHEEILDRVLRLCERQSLPLMPSASP